MAMMVMLSRCVKFSLDTLLLKTPVKDRSKLFAVESKNGFEQHSMLHDDWETKNREMQTLSLPPQNLLYLLCVKEQLRAVATPYH